MILKWTAAWYELDQTIIVGDKDWFYLLKCENSLSFANGLGYGCDIQKKLEIVRIKHPILGDVRGIVTIGLDYTVYLMNGVFMIVNAEEHPGKIRDSSIVIDNWSFDVEVNVLDETANLMEGKTLNEAVRRYKSLLGLTEASWENE